MTAPDGAPLSSLLLAGGRPFRVQPSAPARHGAVWPVEGTWPVPNPVMPLVAVSRLIMSPVPHSELLLVDESTGIVTVIAQSASGDPPVISPGVPHYCHWSSDGEYLAFGIATSAGFEVRVADRQSLAEPALASRGSPIFLSWHPQEPLLALHSGNRVEIHDARSNERLVVLSEQSVGYRAPVFTPDGRMLLYATSDGQSTTLHAADTDSWVSHEVASFDGGLAFSFGPEPEYCYVALSRRPESGAFDSLWRLDLVSGERSRVTVGPFVGQFWAPDRSRFIQIIPRQTGDGRYALASFDAAGQPLGWSDAFVPSDEFRVALSFFDQYSMSHPFWSPDSSIFVAAGRVGGDGLHSAFSGAGPEALAWTGRRGDSFERVAPASIGVFYSSGRQY